MSHSHESINTSRRRFMQAASLSGAAVAVGALTACGKTGASDPKQPASADSGACGEGHSSKG